MAIWKPETPTPEETDQFTALTHDPYTGIMLPEQTIQASPHQSLVHQVPPAPDMQESAIQDPRLGQLGPPPAPKPYDLPSPEGAPSDMTFSVDEANPPETDRPSDMEFSLDEADPQAAALMGRRGNEDMVVPFAEANPDPEAAQRVPSLAPSVMKPAGLSNDTDPSARPQKPPAMQKLAATLPAKAAPQAAAQAAPAKEEAPYEGPSRWGGVLRGLSGVATGILGANSANGSGSPRTLAALSQQTQNRQTHDAADEQARARAATGNRQLKRQSQLDAERAQDRNATAEDRKRRMGQEDIQTNLSAEARDPASQKNATFRQGLEQAYPGIKDKFTPEQWNALTIEGAGAIAPVTDKRKAADKAAADAAVFDKKRTAGLEDKKEAMLYQSKLPVRPGTPGSGGGVGVAPGEGGSDDDTLKALAETYGGEDKIPPTLRRRVALAMALPKNKRAAALNTVLGQSQTDSDRDQSRKDREELNKTKGEMADVKERIAYDNATKDPRRSLEDLDRMYKLLKEQDNVDVDNYHGEGISGIGMVENVAPNFAVGEKGRNNRQQIRGNIATLVLEMSGKAATNSERTELKSIAGAADGMDEAQLIRGLKRLKEIAQAQIKRTGYNFPKAAASYDAERAKDTGTVEPIRIKDPKTGDTGSFVGTAAEAKAKGYEVIN